MNRPDISIIIPFHGSPDVIKDCLTSLENQQTSCTFEIIIVESGLTHSIQDQITDKPNVRVILNEMQMFPGKARNRGVSLAQAEFLAFLDADCYPDKVWLQNVFEEIQDGNKIVVGPILNPNPFQPIVTVDNLLQFVDFQKYQKVKNVSHFSGCNFAITKELFTQTGGFPEDIHLGEDVIFSQDAIGKCDGKMVFNEDMKVWHKGRSNLKSFYRHHYDFGYYRALLELKVPTHVKDLPATHIQAMYMGMRRFIYIMIRTIQWNPNGIFAIVFYFPLVILGLWAWTIGYYKGSQKKA